MLDTHEPQGHWDRGNRPPKDPHWCDLHCDVVELCASQNTWMVQTPLVVGHVPFLYLNMTRMGGL